MSARRIILVAAMALVLLGATAAAQMGGPGGYGYGMGPGMMGGWGQQGGYGEGPGGMGWYRMYPGWGMGPGMMGGYGAPGGGREGWYCPFCGRTSPGYGAGHPSFETPLDESGARSLLETWLKNTRNPNLKIGKIADAGPTFEAEIVTKEGSVADKVIVDKSSGWMRPAY